jgi:hypothetical protein
MPGDLYIFELPALREAERVELHVDRPRRTIAGLAVPWGVPSQVAGGRRYRFAPGVIELPAPISRVKFLREHRQVELLGRATRIEERADGLHAEFLVSRVPEGDRALAEAEDGALDGFSVGVDVLDMGRPDADGILAPRRAKLVEVSLTPFPSFDTARVEHVAASRDQAGAVSANADTSSPVMHDPLPTGSRDPLAGINPPDPGGDFDDPHADVFRGTRAVSPATRLVTAADGAVLRVPGGPDVAGDAAAALVNNVLGGVPLEPPAGYSTAEREQFWSEIERIREPARRAELTELARATEQATATAAAMAEAAT